MEKEVQTEQDEVTISRKEYDMLLKRDEILSALEGAGVDNWCGYSDSLEMIEDDE